jgi:hypothetical protein
MKGITSMNEQDNIPRDHRGLEIVNFARLKLRIKHPLDTEERPIITKEDWAATPHRRDMDIKKAG